tara:strand:- start:1111 stop:1545 length:435 start_codon:yes stop_codon:yes gene_type:complete
MKKKTFNYVAECGDAIIRIKESGEIELCLCEDEHTVERPMVWPEQENYKLAVQFALMIDSFIRNGNALDDIILGSPTGNIASDLLYNDLNIGTIALTGLGEMMDTLPIEDTTEQEGKDIYSGKNPDNVLDLTSRLNNKDNDEND